MIPLIPGLLVIILGTISILLIIRNISEKIREYNKLKKKLNWLRKYQQELRQMIVMNNFAYANDGRMKK